MATVASRMGQFSSMRLLVNDPIAVRSLDESEMHRLEEALRALNVPVRKISEYLIADCGIHAREVVRLISASDELVRVPVFRRDSLLEIPTGEIAVRFHASVPEQLAIATLDAGGFEIARRGRFNEFFVIYYPRSEAGAVTGAARLGGLSGVQNAEPVFLVVL